MTTCIDIPLVEVKVGDRFRKDYGDLEDFADNLRVHGVLQPISIDMDYNLLAGGRRLAAARIAELGTIPAVIQPVSSKANAREIELIENVFRKDLAWTERDALEKEIYELKGGTIRDIADLLNTSKSGVSAHIQMANALEVMPELAKCKTEDEAWKRFNKIRETIAIRELVKRAKNTKDEEKSKSFTWAESKYIVGDTLEEMKQLGSGVFGFAEVDPPYGIDLHGLKRENTPGASEMESYTEVTAEDYGDFLTDVATETFRVLNSNTFCVWWFGPTHYELVLQTLRKVGFAVNEVPAIWYKGNQGQTQHPESNFANCYEPFFVCRKGSPSMKERGRSNVFFFNPIPGLQKIHPTQKPTELMTEILKTLTYPGQTAVVPFLGSGVTLIAAYKYNMNAFGYDLSVEHKNKFILWAEDEFKNEVSTENDDDDLDGAGS